MKIKTYWTSKSSWRILVKITDDQQDDTPCTKEQIMDAIGNADLKIAGLQIEILDAFHVIEE